MKKIGLNIICNNNAPTIGKLLESVRSVTDAIVAVDLGSTDETVSIIKKFGFLSNIPTFVYERPFDNFCNTRNHALYKLREIMQELSWQPKKVWGLVADCDEIVHVGEKFNKEQLSDDLYLVTASHYNDYFMKRTLFRLSVDFHWENPVHEQLSWSTEPVKIATLPSFHITRESQRVSAKPIPEKTWLSYAQLLTEHAKAGHNDFQTLYHIGESYKAAGDSSKTESNARGYYLQAENYYATASQLNTSLSKEKALATHYRAENKLSLGEDWGNIQPLFLLAYSHHMEQAESVAAIIRHYMEAKQWHLAHLFSSFAYKAYHNHPPELDPAGGPIEKSLYAWELLFYHYICCYYTQRKQETKSLRMLLKKYVFTHPKDFRLPQLISIFFSPIFFSSFKTPR